MGVIKVSASEDKKVETTVVEEKETKKSSKKSDEVKVEEPKKEMKELKVEAKANIKKEFVVGAKVLDKKKRQFTIDSFPEGELHDLSNIVLKNDNGILSVQFKGKLQLV